MVDQVIMIITVLVAAASFFFDWWYYSWLPSKRLPPGPAPWPLVGSLFKVRRLGANPLTVAMKLEAEYGKIITLWIGKKPIIVVSDAELAHDALVKQGVTFASKCKLSSKYELSDGFPMINTSDGAYAIALRRLLMSHVLNSTSLRAMKWKRDAVIEDLINKIKVQTTMANQDASKVLVTPLVRFAFFEYSLYVCFGIDTEQAALHRIDEVMEERVKLGHSFYLGDYIPAYRVFEGKIRREFIGSRQRMYETLNPYIQRFREMKQAGNVRPGTYIETLLDLQEKEGKEYLSDLAIAALCTEVINSSTHTVSAAVAAAISHIANDPKLQMKVIKEIEGAVVSKAVDETDLHKLPYLQAVCKEALRMHPPVPAIPHAVAESCELGGYHIPANAAVIFHVDGYLHNPGKWSDPWEFNPERFLHKDVDLVGTRDADFIPFGAGRRVCPGLNLAQMVFSLTVARMVQTFEWESTKFRHKKIQDGVGAALTDHEFLNSSRKSAIKSVDEVRDPHSTYILRSHEDTKAPLIARLR